MPPTTQSDLLTACVVEIDENTIEFTLTNRVFNPSSLMVIADWDIDEVLISL